MRQNSGTANALATKMYEERLKQPLQRDPLDDATMKQRYGDNVAQLLDPNHASMLKSAAAAGQPAGQVLHGTPGGMSGTLQQVQARNQQLLGSTQEAKNEMNPVLNLRGVGPEGSLIGVPGIDCSSGLDQLRSGLLQQQKSFIQSSQPFHQLQLLTPQLQQQLLLQAQQNITSPSASDIDSRRLRMLLNNRNMELGKDGLSNSVGDVVPNVGSPMQAACPVLRGDTEMLIKASKNQTGRKRKQPVSSSGPANSSGTANTAGPSPGSAPSTPSTHTPGDVISMPTLPRSGSSSKPLIMFGSDCTGTLTSTSNQLLDDKDLELQADMDRYVDDGSLDDNVESFLSHDDTDPRDTVGRCTDVSKGFTFTEVGFIRASTSKVVCCHFSSDGKLLASGGHDKKAVLWHTDSLKPKTTLEEHSLLITDVRFSPSMPRLATSSFDKTVRVWDADNVSGQFLSFFIAHHDIVFPTRCCSFYDPNIPVYPLNWIDDSIVQPGYSLRTFTGHSASVMSLDFHPNKEDLICSCDGDSEIRYWSISNGSCARVFKYILIVPLIQGGTTQMRFQPCIGRYLAAAAENVVSILDVETQVCRHSLQGHTKPVHSVCWDPSGEFLASVSEDSVRVWTLGSGSEGECIHELSCNGNKFHSCVFHPTYPSLLVIGCYQASHIYFTDSYNIISLLAIALL
ncbi:hypothetical protein HHK36_021542 [Tetracentron sinense]|uniref:LEUNIG n=1 Tax=Tetracentron sinense TaxID=13715 RepID=A0A835D7X7_TETSI|nr:hypothetical protein HHK36_021542 [Tetracentron sinense]